MRQRGARSRIAIAGQIGVMPIAALAVHQLRYYLAYGSAANVELQRTGHSYLHSLAPWLVSALALSVGAFLWRLGRAAGGRRSVSGYTVSLAALWLACTIALVGIFAAQEFIEGLVIAGHPAGLSGIFGYGGWWAIPAAACLALILASVYHGTRWVLDEVARRRNGGLVHAPRRATRPLRPALLFAPAPAPLIAGWSGRGPPRG